MWLKLNKDDLPKGEVVAVNFERNNPLYGMKYVGKITYRKTYQCCIGWSVVTHYLPLPKDEEREG